jgi:NitT/TauT family transport system ATP-binding protein
MPLKAPERESRSTTRPAVAVSALSKHFPGRDGAVHALDGVSFEAATGETVGIVGPSGCGKSTLLVTIAGLEPPSGGSVALSGECALMPQRDLLLPWRSALDNAGLALELGGTRRSQARRRAAELFERFGLGEFAAARPDELSGGMRQRVAFARTLLAARPVLLLDEPFASLDAITRAELQEWTGEALAAEPRTVLLVTHDVEEALTLSDTVVVLSSRPARIVEHMTVDLPRPRTPDAVTDDTFVAAKSKLLHALEQGRG